MIQNLTFSFKRNRLQRNLYTYYDKGNAVQIHIFKSGWKNYYQCVTEWGEFEDSQIQTLTAEGIRTIFGINTFLRKEKLETINKINLKNESNL